MHSITKFAVTVLCVKTVITYGKIRLCRGPTGLIPGVGQRSSRFQTRISGRDAFLTYLQFCLNNVLFQLCRVLTLQSFFISKQNNQLFASCVSSLCEGYSGNRRRQDLHPSSSNKPKQCVCVCLFVWFVCFVLFCFVCLFVCVCVCTVCVDVKLLYIPGGTGATLVPVPTKTARCQSDINVRRPFDVPVAFLRLFSNQNGTGPSREPLHRILLVSLRAICTYI